MSLVLGDGAFYEVFWEIEGKQIDCGELYLMRREESVARGKKNVCLGFLGKFHF